MELELKHITPYLPYELKIARLSIDGNFKKIEYSFRATNLVEILRYDNLKPILRPLSDLKKNEFPFKLGTYTQNFKFTLENTEYQFIERMIELHFDVFGLIEKGLAIDINTLPQSSE